MKPFGELSENDQVELALFQGKLDTGEELAYALMNYAPQFEDDELRRMVNCVVAELNFFTNHFEEYDDGIDEFFTDTSSEDRIAAHQKKNEPKEN